MSSTSAPLNSVPVNVPIAPQDDAPPKKITAQPLGTVKPKAMEQARAAVPDRYYVLPSRAFLDANNLTFDTAAARARAMLDAVDSIMLTGELFANDCRIAQLVHPVFGDIGH